MQHVPPYLNFAEGRFESLSAEVSTSDATPTQIIQITPEPYSRGSLTVWINGSRDDGSEGIIGAKMFHWKCVNETVTLLATIDIVPVNREVLTTANFALDVGDDLLQVKVTGEAAKNINWSAFYLFDSITTTSLP